MTFTRCSMFGSVVYSCSLDASAENRVLLYVSDEFGYCHLILNAYSRESYSSKGTVGSSNLRLLGPPSAEESFVAVVVR